MKHADYRTFISLVKKHLFPLILVSVPCDFEKAQCLASIVKAYKKQLRYEEKFLNAEEHSLDEVINSMQAAYLFGDLPLVVFDHVDKLSKKDLDRLYSALSHRTDQGVVILASHSVSKFKKFSSLLGGKGAHFDLTAEKPWEKEKRLKSYFLDLCFKQKKHVQDDVVQHFFQRVGFEKASVVSETEKLLTYTFDMDKIEKVDIDAICSMVKENSLWHISETVVWDHSYESLLVSKIDSQFFYGILPLLRFQLNTALKLALMIDNRATDQEIIKAFPKIWPKALEKKRTIAQRIGADKFSKAIAKLYEIEMYAKSGVSHYQGLLDLFLGAYR
ncbi:MAG TPA: hypothetical protein P5048_01610 [Chlamydiales bacterium]|nr:hypothetical protein [Chlamydiales bacterium]